MHASFDDRRISPIVTHQCPVCRGNTTLALVEPHPVRAGWEIHTYTCAKCGANEPRNVASPSRAGTPLLPT